jgi:hypothetical protein
MVSTTECRHSECHLRTGKLSLSSQGVPLL